MRDQSHRDEMSAAIRAQRQRQAATRAAAPPTHAPERPEQPSRKRWLVRLRGK